MSMARQFITDCTSRQVDDGTRLQKVHLLIEARDDSDGVGEPEEDMARGRRVCCDICLDDDSIG